MEVALSVVAVCDIASRIASAVEHAIRATYMISEFKTEIETFINNLDELRSKIDVDGTQGNWHSLFTEQAPDLEISCCYRRDDPCVSQVPEHSERLQLQLQNSSHLSASISLQPQSSPNRYKLRTLCLKCPPIYNYTLTNWRHKSDHLGGMKKLETELLSLQEKLHVFERVMECQHDNEKAVGIRFEEQLKMVISVCEEVCTRANKAMLKMVRTWESRRWVPCVSDTDIKAVDRSYRDAEMGTSGLRSFSSLPGLAEVLISKTSTGPLQFEKDPYVRENATTEKGNIVVERLMEDITQQALSIRRQVRAALPDQGLLHKILDAPIVLCFLLGTMICPSLIWLTLQSLKLEPPSLLDQRLLASLPFLAIWIANLGRHPTMALMAMIASIAISTSVLVVTAWMTCMKGRSLIFACCWLLMAAGSPFWTLLGGSVFGLFLVFMPFALSLGVALGLLWHTRMSHGQHV